MLRDHTDPDKWRTADQHRTIWDASGVTSGTYFIRLERSGNMETKRVHLVRQYVFLDRVKVPDLFQENHPVRD